MMTLMIPQDEMKKYVHVKTVGRKELDHLTEHGWRLIATVAEESFECDSSYGPQDMWQVYQQALQQSNYRNGQAMAMPTPTPPTPIKRTFYVVGLDLNDTILALAEERDLAQRHGQAGWNKHGLLSQEMKKAEEALQQSLTTTATLGSRVVALTEQNEKLTESLRKMEADLAKVRSAVGELKWKEIVGGPVPT